MVPDDGHRLVVLERNVDELQRQATRVPVLESKIEAMGREIGEIKTAMREGFREAKEDGKATRRVLMTFAFTIAGSAVLAILTVLIATGGAA